MFEATTPDFLDAVSTIATTTQVISTSYQHHQGANFNRESAAGIVADAGKLLKIAQVAGFPETEEAATRLIDLLNNLIGKSGANGTIRLKGEPLAELMFACEGAHSAARIELKSQYLSG